MMDNEKTTKIRQQIEKLIDDYKNIKKSKSDKEMASISEANVRADFIDRLFGILGWDVNNPDEYDREHFIRGAGFADIALKLNNNPVVFVEAKRFGGIPHSKDVKGDWTIEERQAILYAAGKQCKWAVLTNFEKFRVFNALTGLTVLKLESVDDYKNRIWDIIHLTKEFVASDKIDKLGAREEKELIDMEFLGLLNKWRRALANDIYANNFLNEGKPPDLSKLFPDYEKYEKNPKYTKFLESRREILKKRIDFSVLKDEKGTFDIERLKSAVQRILDRLIIIRWAEDHLLLDDSNILGGKLKLWKAASRYNPLYEGLFADGALFDKFNDIHNGELFKRGLFYDRVTVSDDVLARIIEEMTSHSFRKFNFDVLGNTYETYLGNTLYLKDDNTFDLKPSQETRKESGIYYTPPYIVDYIVKNTLNALISGKTPDEVARIKVLDPACGSGSFLIKAYDCFANYYDEKNREIKVRFEEHLKNNMLFETSESMHDGYETSILLNNIHGVDLDAQAAEIAAVNLMLKALKPDEILPPILGDTINVGNSLISGSEEELVKYFGEDWREKKPFNWEEGFADVFDKALAEEDKGFDVVIGNPPYINVSNLLDKDRDFLMEKYESALKRLDIYVAFIEKGIRLLKNGGKLSFIIPYPFLNQKYAEKLRKLILDNCIIEEIVDLSKFKIFADATVRNIIIILKNEPDKQKRDATKIKITTQIEDPTIQDKITGDIYFIQQSLFYSVPEYMFRLELNEMTIPLIEKIKSKSIKFGKIAVVSWGARGVPVSDFHLDRQINDLCKMMVKGENIGRYSLNYNGKWLLYDISKLYRPSFPQLFDNEKLIISKVTGATGLIATLDDTKYYTDDSLNCGILKYHLEDIDSNTLRKHKLYLNNDDVELSKNYNLKYALALINSRLINFYFKTLLGYELNVYPESIEQLPLYPIDFSNPSEKSAHDDLIVLVDRMLAFNKQLSEINADFPHYLNLYPHNTAPLNNIMDTLPVGDKEVLKDPIRKKSYSILDVEKFKEFALIEKGEWLEFKVAHSYKSGGKIKRSSLNSALRFRIENNSMRKFILYSLKNTTPGKLGKGNILKQLQKLKIPRFVINIEENRRTVEELMAPFLIETAKKEVIEQEIRQIDDEIDKKVYALYGLTDDEIKTIKKTVS